MKKEEDVKRIELHHQSTTQRSEVRVTIKEVEVSKYKINVLLHDHPRLLCSHFHASVRPFHTSETCCSSSSVKYN